MHQEMKCTQGCGTHVLLLLYSSLISLKQEEDLAHALALFGLTLNSISWERRYMRKVEQTHVPLFPGGALWGAQEGGLRRAADRVSSFACFRLIREPQCRKSTCTLQFGVWNSLT